jgi:hypothetical protein
VYFTLSIPIKHFPRKFGPNFGLVTERLIEEPKVDENEVTSYPNNQPLKFPTAYYEVLKTITKPEYFYIRFNGCKVTTTSTDRFPGFMDELKLNSRGCASS